MTMLMPTEFQECEFCGLRCEPVWSINQREELVLAAWFCPRCGDEQRVGLGEES